MPSRHESRVSKSQSRADKDNQTIDLNRYIELNIATDHYNSLYLVLFETFFFVWTYTVVLPDLIEHQRDLYIFFLASIGVKLLFSQ